MAETSNQSISEKRALEIIAELYIIDYYVPAVIFEALLENPPSEQGKQNVIREICDFTSEQILSLQDYKLAIFAGTEETEDEIEEHHKEYNQILWPEVLQIRARFFQHYLIYPSCSPRCLVLTCSERSEPRHWSRTRSLSQIARAETSFRELNHRYPEKPVQSERLP
jgi:hypothetical protein